MTIEKPPEINSLWLFILKNNKNPQKAKNKNSKRFKELLETYKKKI